METEINENELPYHTEKCIENKIDQTQPFQLFRPSLRNSSGPFVRNYSVKKQTSPFVPSHLRSMKTTSNNSISVALRPNRLCVYIYIYFRIKRAAIDIQTTSSPQGPPHLNVRLEASVLMFSVKVYWGLPQLDVGKGPMVYLNWM